MLWIFIIETAPRRPRVAVVAVVGKTAGILEHPRHVHPVSGHDRGGALREFVVEPCAVVAVARARPRLSDPAAIGLRRDRLRHVIALAVREVLRSAEEQKMPRRSGTSEPWNGSFKGLWIPSFLILALLVSAVTALIKYLRK